MKFGVCYYPEHWPEEMWADDAKRMKALGLTHVRIGEFAWAKIEPEEGTYDWDWLDRAVETLSAAGLEIIMGTPTATPPKWLIDRYPDVLPCDAHGHPRQFGSRRHYSFSSKTYRALTTKIVTAMAERYGAHPAVSMWQTDNEYGCHDTVESNDPDARTAFRDWLKAKYGTIDALNTAWGTIFWSQTYQNFDAIDPPLATVTEANPSHVMDWQRFSSDQVASYNALQSDIIRQHAKGRDVTHNFMGHFTAFDHYPVGRQLDLSTWDSYPLGFLEQAWWDADTKVRYAQTGHPDFAAFHHDLYRGMSKGRFGVMEQQPGPVNWARYNPAPKPGMVALWTLEAIAHGAELVSYFRWRQVPFAQEQLHAGMNRRDNVPDQAAIEFEAVQAVLEKLGKLPETSPADVALVYDYQAHWAHEIQPQGRSFRHDELTFVFYTALRQLGLDIDIISPDADGAGYKLIVVPSSPMLSAAQITKLTSGGAHLLCGPRTGSKTEDFQLPANLAPGPLQDLLPVKATRVESLRPGLRVSASRHVAERWFETIETELEPLIESNNERGIAWQNEKATYLAAWPDENLAIKVCGIVADLAGVKTHALPEGLRLRRRGDLLFMINYSGGAEHNAYGSPTFLSGHERIVCDSSKSADLFAAYRRN